MKINKRIFAIVMSVLMLIAYMPGLAYAEGENIAEGTCGTCEWVIDANGVLTISEGVLGGWEWEEYSPWHPYRAEITAVKTTGTVKLTTGDHLFYNCTALTNLDLRDFDTSDVTSMGNMFYGCRSLTSLDVSSFDTSKCSQFSGMFMYCQHLTDLNVSNFDTSKAWYMQTMFSGCESLTELNVSNFNTDSVQYMFMMFSGCKSLTGLDLSNFNTSNVYQMQDMFSGCESLTSLNISNFDTGKCNQMQNMFSNCRSLTELDVSSFDVNSDSFMQSMFDGCTSLKTLTIGKGFNNTTEHDRCSTFPIAMYDSVEGTKYEAGAVIPLLTDPRIFVAEKTDDVPDPDTSLVDSGFTTSYNDKEKIIPYKYGFRYRDEYFTGDATDYNHNLATMSLCLALSGYGYGDYSTYDKNVKTLMEQCGFADGNYYESYHYNEKPTKDSIACAIGSKIISINGSEVPVIAVAVRSSGYEAEWASNLTIGDDGNHDGFDRSAEAIKNYIIDYITNKQIKGDIKIWITGFSRGAAVATQTAAKLDDLAGFAYPDESSESGYTRVDFDNSSIYAYGFATPAGVLTSNDPHSSKYSNIFNIIEYNDPVPLVAPENWSFDRYGTTKILPYRESNNSEDFRRYIELLELRVDAGNGYNIDKFKNYNFANQIAKKNHDTQGTFLRKTVNALAKTIGSRSKYNEKYQATVRQAIENKYANRKNDMYLTTDIIDILIAKVPQFVVLHPNLSVTLTENLETLAEVHADTDYYLGWMQMMDRNYDNSLPLVWGNPNYRVWKSNCPVDVYVYDANNNVVASIVNEEPSDDENQEIIVSIDENGQKIAYLPVDSDYRVEVKAREACEVSCGVEEYNAEFGESARIVNFETVTLSASEALSADIPAFSEDEITEGAAEGSDVSYSMKKDDKVIEVESDIHGEEAIAAHTYNVSTVYDDTMGVVYGGGSFTEGTFALIEYACKDGYILDGFYIDGKKYEGSISEDHSIRIKVTKDTEIKARFVKGDDPDPTPVDPQPVDPTPVNPQPAPIVTPTPVAPAEIVDLPAVKISKPKAAKKKITVKWKKVSKKILKKIGGIQIQVATDPSFTNIVKTATAGKKKTSKTIKGLSPKTKYYVRIRAYAADNHVSAWKTKSVNVK